MSGPARCFHCQRLVEDVDEVVLHRSCASGHDATVPPHCVWEGDEGFVCGMPKEFPWHVESGNDETMHRYVPSDGIRVPDGIVAIMIPPRAMTASDVEAMYRVLRGARKDGREIMSGEPGWLVYRFPR